MRKAIIIFTRVPLEGNTKTRLMPFLTAQECAGLHEAFIKDTYASSKKTGEDILIFHTPEDPTGILKRLLHEEERFFMQRGGEIGQRMRHAIMTTLGMGYDACVLIGTDIPQIKDDIICRAFDNLQAHDIVINPTIDGGYYLIGMRRDWHDVWKIKHYGTNTVIHDTLKHLKNADRDVVVGEICRDIDTEEDLRLLYKELDQLEEKGCTHTWNYMKQHLVHQLNAERKESYGQQGYGRMYTL